MDYICYLSRSKTDSLHAQLVPELHDEIVEQVMTERAGTGDVRAGLSVGGIVSLFNGGITYGRKNVVQRERKIKAAYVHKLREVLLDIAAEHGDIPDVREAMAEGSPESVFYFYSGPFRVTTPVSNPTTADVVTLRSDFDGHSLLLDCSLRYFSEGPEADDSFLLHSGNRRFFTSGTTLTLEGAFVLLGRQGRDVIGTPLYLQLSPSGHFQAL